MRFFDFFAGIGGFRLGMEMAGHECVGHCEVDKYAHKSYVAMHHPKESEVFFQDVRTIEPELMPECECYCFGFPCQAFSISGKRRGFEDARGTLFFEVMRIAKERKPQILFAENVAGLLNHEGGVTFGVILSAMAELGYSCEWQVLNSKDFGVPQHRQRVFIVGHLGRIGGRTVFPITENGGSSAELQGFGNRDRVICNTLVSSHQIVAERGRGEGWQQQLEPREDGLTNSLTSATKDNMVHEGIRIRKLTPKECFRLQGFPDEYFERAAQVCSDSQLYKQAGNSVTVNVIYEIAKRLKEIEE